MVLGINFRGFDNSQFHRMRELVDSGPHDETCCHRSYSNELALEFNNDKIHENELLGILMKHRYVYAPRVPFPWFLVNKLYKCTHTIINIHM